MLTDKRIQVYFPAREYKSIKAKAKEEGKSIAQVLREAAAIYLRRDAKEEIRAGLRKLLDGSGKYTDTATDVAERHDDYLGEALEEEWRRWQSGKRSM